MISNDLLSEVSDLIKNSHETVKQKLVSVLVEREINERVDLLVSAINKLKDIKKELDKIKPDIETFDAITFTKLPTQFSKSKWEEKKKMTERKEKLEKVIDSALDGEFEKLREVMKE